MIDVFIKSWTEEWIRHGLALSVVARCLRLPCRLHLIVAEGSIAFPPDLKLEVSILPREQFWIGSKAFAEARAESSVYVVLDDDHMPIGTDWLDEGVSSLDARPDYACLSSWSINGEVPEGGGYVWASECTGTPYFIRKGILNPKRMPVGSLPNYDAVLSAEIRKSGSIGFMRSVRHNHLGYGLSKVIPGWWKV